MSCTPGSLVGTVYSVIAPPVVTRPILLTSVNHTAPSGPATMPWHVQSAVGTVNSVMLPVVVIRPILLPLASVNHTAPSGPAVMSQRLALLVRTVYSVITPPVVIRPILLALFSVNHNAPSGPAVMPSGWALLVVTGYSVMSDTLMDAVAELPAPVPAAVTLLVVLTLVPVVVAVTLTWKLQAPNGTIVPPDRLTLVPPAGAVIVPLPHDPERPLGVETTRPLGIVSVKPMPLRLKELGLKTVKVSPVLLSTAMADAAKLLLRVGGLDCAKAAPAPPQISPAAITAGIARRTQARAAGTGRAMFARVRLRHAAFKPFMIAPAKTHRPGRFG